MGCVPNVLFILNIVSLQFQLILLAWKTSSQGYIPILIDEINLSLLFIQTTVDSSTHGNLQVNPYGLKIKMYLICSKLDVWNTMYALDITGFQ